MLLTSGTLLCSNALVVRYTNDQGPVVGVVYSSIILVLFDVGCNVLLDQEMHILPRQSSDGGHNLTSC